MKPKLLVLTQKSAQFLWIFSTFYGFCQKVSTCAFWTRWKKKPVLYICDDNERVRQQQQVFHISNGLVLRLRRPFMPFMLHWCCYIEYNTQEVQQCAECPLLPFRRIYFRFGIILRHQHTSRALRIATRQPPSPKRGNDYEMKHVRHITIISTKKY